MIRRVVRRIWRFTMSAASQLQEIIDRLRVLDARITVLDGQLVRMETVLTRIQRQERREMVSIAELQAKADKTLERVQAEASVVQAVKNVVEHGNEMIATLKQQLADAIAAGVDPAALQKLADTLDAAEQTDMANAQVVADAVVAGTPVEEEGGNGGTTGGTSGGDPDVAVDDTGGTAGKDSGGGVTGGDGGQP